MDRLLGRLFLACVLTALAVNTFASGHSFELKQLIKEAKRSESESRHRHNENETEFWGYVDVRPGAHMFYWLYHSYHPDEYLNRSLIIWLQVREASVLFIDNPVGAGFSYVDASVASYTTNIDEITDDLISFTRQFIDMFPQFSQMPIYVFGESYGGKMAAHFSNKLYHEAAAGRISVNVVGFSMGNAWIAPDEQIMSYGPLYYQLSLIDEAQFETLQSTAARAKEQVAAGRYQDAWSTFGQTLTLLWKYSNGVDFYNFLVYHRNLPSDKRTLLENEAGLDYSPSFSSSTQASDDLPDFMNGPVRRILGIIPPEVTWQITNIVAKHELRDIMASAVHVVDDSLLNTTLQVIVMEGQLDIICDSGGAMRWVQTLSWPGLDNYNSTDRQALVNPDTELTEAFVKAHDRLKFYWILGAGHSVAKDNGGATYRVLQRILGNVDV